MAKKGLSLFSVSSIVSVFFWGLNLGLLYVFLNRVLNFEIHNFFFNTWEANIATTGIFVCISIALGTQFLVCILQFSKRLSALPKLLIYIAIFLIILFKFSSDTKSVVLGSYLRIDDFKYLYETISGNFSFQVLCTPLSIFITTYCLLISLCYFFLLKYLSSYFANQNLLQTTAEIFLLILILNGIYYFHSDTNQKINFESSVYPFKSSESNLTISLIRNENSFQPDAAKVIYPSKISKISTSPTTKKNIVIFLVEALRSDSSLPKTTAALKTVTDFKQAYSIATDTATSLYSILNGKYPFSGMFEREYFNSPFYDSKNLFVNLGTKNFKSFFAFEQSFSTEKEKLTAKRWGINDFNFLQIDQSDESKYDWLNIDKENINKSFKFISDNKDSKTFSVIYLGSSHFPYGINVNNNLVSLMNAYRNSIDKIDIELAAYVHKLRDQNLLDDTIIFILGDHGEAFYEHGELVHGGSIYEESTRIKFLVYGIDSLVSQKTISSIDIAPTVAELTGLDISDYQGYSLLDNSPQAMTRPIFTFTQTSIFAQSVLCFPDKLSYQYSKSSAELYNLKNDPMEKQNLFLTHPMNQQRLSTIIKNMRDRQYSYLKDYKLNSSIKSPEELSCN